MGERLVKSEKRPACKVAIEQCPGVWLVSDDAKEATATALDVALATLPHPEGHGRTMLRQVPAGTVLIEVVDAKPVSTTAEAVEPIDMEPKPLEEPLEEVPRGR